MKQHRPYFMYAVTLAQLALVILSFAVNKDMTGEFIQTQPSLNYMIGPAAGPLIRMGARFVPCIRTVPTYTSNSSMTYLPYCPTGVTTPCKLADVCGFDGKADQWFRFIVPIFLHGGIVHFIFNAAFQLRTGVSMERDFGPWRIGIIYMASGIAGFVFGANFNVLSVSVGSSGALYGLLACLLLDLFQNWSLIQRPWIELLKMSVVVIISLSIGLLPFIDNFAHLGGFFTGILSGLIFMPTITFGKWDKRRKRILMVLAIPAIIVIFVLLFVSFYSGRDANCSWCKYLDCIPVMGWCDDLTS
ncbi:rhomboid-domain-containing protein [Gonapodya prolifera JEL478]|uniref:Rhomboid-domain-containing protein n=1 Tax=Gonapodya prolifera (strain JEL478) TaxID=1344416 RepID=A0A139AQG9_GONPJ|nr:rhomboid-domain-containing protein [Gonapodya prolifera JEL478]|eukprot:KXS18904.1 rhomboid-domain-containing protein [Gonapodya prolifera JEL478]